MVLSVNIQKDFCLGRVCLGRVLEGGYKSLALSYLFTFIAVQTNTVRSQNITEKVSQRIEKLQNSSLNTTSE